MKSESSSLPSANEFIRECLFETTCTRVGFRPQLRRETKTVVARLYRNGQDFWSGSENRGLLSGHTDSYPTIDMLGANVFVGPEQITLTELMGNFLPLTVESKLQSLLDGIEVYLRPKVDTLRVVWDVRHEPHIYMRLHAPRGVPTWLCNLDDLRMGGIWRAFIDPKSSEYAIAKALIAHESAVRAVAESREKFTLAQEGLTKLVGELPSLEQEARRLLGVTTE